MDKGAKATRELSGWIVDRKREPASDDALALAELSVVDTIACALAGTCEPGPWALRRTRRIDPGLPATVWGMPGSAEPRDAALLNGMLAHMLDYDDGDMVSRGHPSCMILPALFAVGETRDSSGRDVLDAFITGYHVMQLVGRVSGRALAKRGFQTTSVLGVIGATAALSRLVGLTAGQTAAALGIAASTACGLRANFGTDMKAYHTGRAASTAVEVVEMAKEGVTASEEIFEARDGFVWTLADPELAGRIPVEVERLLAGAYSIEKEPPNIKLFACCHSTHACIEAILALRPQLIDRLGAIKEIVAEAPHTAAIYLIHPRPENGLEGKFSMEGSVALALLDGRAGAADFTDATFQRADVQDMLRKVRFVTSDRLEAIHAENKMPGVVTVAVDDETLSVERSDTRGCRTERLTLADVAAKFRDCAAGVLADDDTASALALLSDFRNVRSIRDVSQFLRVAPPETEQRARALAEAV